MGSCGSFVHAESKGLRWLSPKDDEYLWTLIYKNRATTVRTREIRSHFDDHTDTHCQDSARETFVELLNICYLRKVRVPRNVNFEDIVVRPASSTEVFTRDAHEGIATRNQSPPETDVKTLE